MTLSETVLITGAAGFIGSHLAEACLARGWTVRAVDCLTDYYERDIKLANLRSLSDHENCTYEAVDLASDDLEGLLDGVDIVFHLAAQPGVRGSWGGGFETYVRHNISAFQRLLEVTARRSIKRFVYASSSSVYGDAETLPTPEDVTPAPVSPYGMTKVAGEQLAAVYFRNHQLPVVGLRYFTVFGPRQRPDMAFNRMLTAALNGDRFVVFGDGRQTRDFTFVTDAVAGTLAAGVQGVPGSVYNLGGGARVSMLEVFAMAAELMDCEIDLEFVSRQQGDARDTAADVSRARAELGFSPQVGVRAGLERQLQWQRDQVTVGRT